MEDRRSILKILASWALALPLAPSIASGLAPAAALAATPVARTAAGVDGFFIVNGWVLTRADLDALQIDAL